MVTVLVEQLFRYGKKEEDSLVKEEGNIGKLLS